MHTLSINNAITGSFVVIATIEDEMIRVSNTVSDPLVPKLRELLASSTFGQLELRIDGASVVEHHFESVKQRVVQTLEKAVEEIKKSALR